MDFADQLARAARVARDHPGVGEIERDRFRVVLLDEYQDTSHAQVVLLNALFGGGHPVTAVGDPCQSIYGWRGASAGTLDRFPTEFARAGGEPAEALGAHHELAQPAGDPSGGQRAVRAAAGGRRPGAGAARRAERPRPDPAPQPARAAGGTVHCALLPTYADEADWIADSVLAAWRGAAADARRAARAHPGGRSGRPPPCWSGCAARSRRSRRRCGPAGCRSRWSGLGGLLDTPEVRDVVCTLRVLADPTDGAALLRLLTGARWRIGPRDLVALHRRARAIASGPPPRWPADDERGDQPPTVLDEATLVEALADLGAGAGVLGGGLRAAARVRHGAGAAALPPGPAAARPDRGHRTHHRPGRGGGGAGRPGRRRRRRAGPGPPGRAGRRGGPVQRGDARRRRWPASWPTWPPPRTRSAGSPRARSRWWRARCRCSPRTPRRAWSGTWWRWPG